MYRDNTYRRIDPSAARSMLRIGDRPYTIYRLDAAGVPDLDRLPYIVKVFLENVLRAANARERPRRAGGRRGARGLEPGAIGRGGAAVLPGAGDPP